ncbi:MAG: flippase [Candidatus Dadabacteria bacterium]|nr:flippase [Candidatus Dadabacteria bacterium]
MDSGTHQTIKTVKKRLFRNASWLFGGKTLAGVFSAIQTVILARLLGVDNYGLLALIIAFVDVLNNFFDFRVWETATKYIGTFWTNGEKEKTLSMIKLSYIIDILSGLLAFIIAILTAKIASSYLIHSPNAYTLIWVYSLSLLIDTSNSTSDAILRVFDRFKRIAFISSFISLFKLILVFLSLYLGMGINGVLISFVSASFLGFFIRMWIVSKTLAENQLNSWWKSNLSPVKNEWKGIAWFIGNTSFSGTVMMANESFMGVLFLGYFSGKEAAAYYKVAQSFVKLISRIMDPVYEAIYPELVRISTLNALKDFKRLLKYSTKNLIKFTIPAAFAVLLFANPIISLIFGKEYLPAANTLRIITVAVLISQLTFWIAPALLAFGRPGLRTLMLIISNTSYIALLFLLVPKHSYIGAAFAFLGYAIVRSFTSIICLNTSIKKEKDKISEPQATLPHT